MSSLVQVYARSAWRVRAIFDGPVVPPNVPTLSNLTISRADGGPTTIVVQNLFGIDSSSGELSLSERMIEGVGYLLTYAGVAYPIGYTAPVLVGTTSQYSDGDPDAEVNGVDLAWVSNDPGPDGDCQRRTGIACVEYDLPNRAVLRPGELVQDQSAGAALDLTVNGAASDSDLLATAAKLEAEFRRDDRVQDVSVDASSDSEGDVTYGGQVQTRAGQQAQVRSN